jgi:uncharacterized protein (TIGR02118 family)
MGDERDGLMKVTWVCRYQREWDRERAQRYWRTHHARLGRRVATMPWYQQNHWTEAVGPTGVLADRPLRYDGFSVCWYPGPEGYEASRTNPDMLRMTADAFNVFAHDEMWGGMSASLDDHVTDLGTTPEIEMFKLGWTASHRAGRDRDEARRTWFSRHGDLLSAVPGLRRHALSHTVQTIGQHGLGAGGPLGFDGLTELWFDDRPSWLEAVRTPQWRAVLEDADDLFDMGEVWSQGLAGVVDHAWINDRLDD